jgi:hypothetical protein
MQTELDIANAALSIIGADSIMSFSDATKSAREAKKHYHMSRRAVLRMHMWNFATQRVVLAPLATTPAFDYDYEHQLPADFLRVCIVNNGDEEFRAENGKLLINNTVVYLKYIYNCENAALFDVLFAESLAQYLAWKISYPITQSDSVKQEAWNSFRSILPIARFTDATDGPQLQIAADDIFESRKNFRNYPRDPQT